uniref:Uncharacterized protein n=1 Tax=Romanomermis culicivorax TaxID=13658 RepID=A0A915HQF6_ROMCU
MLVKYAARAATALATGKVTTQAMAILRNVFQETPPSFDLNQPTQTTAPTAQCVVLTGMPILLATKTVKPVPNSMAKPLQKPIILFARKITLRRNCANNANLWREIRKKTIPCELMIPVFCFFPVRRIFDGDKNVSIDCANFRFRIIHQLMPSVPFNTNEKPIVAPTAQCVVETGKCITVANISQNAVPVSKIPYITILFNFQIQLLPINTPNSPNIKSAAVYVVQLGLK